jgi:hypothetical protein
MTTNASPRNRADVRRGGAKVQEDQAIRSPAPSAAGARSAAPGGGRSGDGARRGGVDRNDHFVGPNEAELAADQLLG